MSDKTREHISSLMDGEVSAETGRFLLRRLGSDAELGATWAGDTRDRPGELLDAIIDTTPAWLPAGAMR